MATKKMTFDKFTSVYTALPQGPHIQAADARRWFESVMDNEPERLEWHTRRLMGLGGSEIGDVIAVLMGERPSFSTPADIAKFKLMQIPIQKPDKYMRRGTFLEEGIRQMFYTEHGAKQREDLMQSFDGVTGQSGIPDWMLGNPDDIVEMDGQLILVDYKAPSHVAHTVPFGYQAQLHHYGFKLNCLLKQRGQGEVLTNMMLASLDYEKASVVLKDVPVNPELIRTLLKEGQHFWKKVTQGIIPDVVPYHTHEMALSDDEREKLVELERLNAKLKVILDETEKKKEKISQEIETFLKGDGSYLLKGVKSPFQLSTMTVRQKLVERDFFEIIKASGVSIESFYKPSKSKLDTKKMLARLEALGENKEDFLQPEIDVSKVISFCEEKGIKAPVNESVSVFINSRSKKLDKSQLNSVKESASQMIDDVLNQIHDVIPEPEFNDNYDDLDAPEQYGNMTM